MNTIQAYTTQPKATPNRLSRRPFAEGVHPASAAAMLALRGMGWTHRTWAAANGYKPGAVYACIRIWVPRTDRQPHGGIARQIREDLRRELGDALVPPLEIRS